MGRTAFVLSLLGIALITWFLIAMYMAIPKLPDPPEALFLIEEPDAGSGVMPAEYNANAAPRTVLTMCLVTPQNQLKIVEDS